MIFFDDPIASSYYFIVTVASCTLIGFLLVQSDYRNLSPLRQMRKGRNHNWIVESVNSTLLHFSLHKLWLNLFRYFGPKTNIFLDIQFWLGRVRLGRRTSKRPYGANLKVWLLIQFLIRKIAPNRLFWDHLGTRRGKEIFQIIEHLEK